ncbi:MAG: UDP-3-O-(3-hydroxymyristoyl)glucosamine N-acyltransferase [Planctomycetota bacterium]
MRLTELCNHLRQAGFPAALEGEDRSVEAVNTLEESKPGELSFLSNPKYRTVLATTKASAVLVKTDVDVPEGVTSLRCNDPYGAVTVAIILLHGHRKHPAWGLSAKASIDPSASIGKEANIAPGVTISANVVIGEKCTIYPGCYVGGGVRIGRGCILFPNVVIYDHCILGDRVTIHAGSVIGEDGLGYAPHEGRWVKIPQIGRTVIGDDVEIGANCAIDRATLGQTEIGSGSKFGNVIVIGHGTKIGPNCMFVGMVGIAGSVSVGSNVTLAGQVGVAGHLEIGEGAKIGGQSGILFDVEPNAVLLGTPAMPVADTKRSMLLYQKLPDMVRRIKQMEQEVERLRAAMNGSCSDETVSTS